MGKVSFLQSEQDAAKGKGVFSLLNPFPWRSVAVMLVTFIYDSHSFNDYRIDIFSPHWAMQPVIFVDSH